MSQRIADVLDVDHVYTFARDPELATRIFGDRPLTASRLGETNLGLRHWRWLLPIMGRWWRTLDLSTYDAVITCSHAVVNSVHVRPDALHVSYCCTPMRYAWSWRSEIGRVPTPLRPAWPVVATALRTADRKRAGNVQLFLAVSQYIAHRIHESYGRRSVVLYPPVDTEFFTPDPTRPRDDFFLVAGRLVAYKRTDIAVRAATDLGVRLVVAGDGPELRQLRAIAGSTVEFRPAVSDAELRDLYRRAKGVLFPGVEDFGIVPVEAQACGAPVIAHAVGGALESVRHGVTGTLYADASAEGLAAAMRTFERSDFDPRAARENGERFGVAVFDRRLREIVGPIVDAPSARRRALIDEILRASPST